MDDEEVEAFLEEFAGELRDSRFSDLADQDELRDVDLDDEEFEARRPRDPRKEAYLMLVGLKSQIALYHRDTAQNALNLLNAALDEGRVGGVAIVREHRASSDIEAAVETIDFTELPDMSQNLEAIEELIELVITPRERLR